MHPFELLSSYCSQEQLERLPPSHQRAVAALPVLQAAVHEVPHRRREGGQGRPQDAQPLLWQRPSVRLGHGGAAGQPPLPMTSRPLQSAVRPPAIMHSPRPLAGVSAVIDPYCDPAGRVRSQRVQSEQSSRLTLTIKLAVSKRCSHLPPCCQSTLDWLHNFVVCPTHAEKEKMVYCCCCFLTVWHIVDLFQS